MDNIKLVVSRYDINYEEENKYNLKVLCTSSRDISFDISLMINVLDVNEAPENVHLNTVILQEGNEIGQLVARIIAVDPEGDQVKYNFIFSWKCHRIKSKPPALKQIPT